METSSRWYQKQEKKEEQEVQKTQTLKSGRIGRKRKAGSFKNINSLVS